jgi:hypothetical protein
VPAAALNNRRFSIWIGVAAGIIEKCSHKKNKSEIGSKRGRTPPSAWKRMQRFKIGESVLILPKFAHLYVKESGIVVSTQPDPFRPIFNEYTIQFADGSTADLFEFQILDNPPNYTTILAALAFDSLRQAATGHVRGSVSGRHIILRAGDIDIDLKLQSNKTRASILGQILERGTARLVKQAEVRLMKESIPLTTATSDSTGIFKFDAVTRGPLNILVLVPQNSIRVIGAFHA